MAVHIHRPDFTKPNYQLDTEAQLRINISKYQALAYGTQPWGPLLFHKVEEHWIEWLDLISRAPWLNHWVHTEIVAPDKHSVTPSGKEVPTDQSTAIVLNKTIDVGTLALTLFTEAVWGFGIEDWLHKPLSKEAAAHSTQIVSAILKLRGINTLAPKEPDLWDPLIFRGCCLYIPYEFGTLDRWLEKLWLEVLDEIEQQKLEAVAREKDQRAANVKDDLEAPRSN